ncbi:hypothetical protein [Roseburia sp. 1XD42-69]|uniref:hypothetical protein n=1 Tax=Roseburia sp. 1XD42-69 TaxID=2320088 RepID=UPI000EA2B804|nr:hypothetical protein [Roseburia sp. 1XD42-69]
MAQKNSSIHFFIFFKIYVFNSRKKYLKYAPVFAIIHLYLRGYALSPEEKEGVNHGIIRELAKGCL